MRVGLFVLSLLTCASVAHAQTCMGSVPISATERGVASLAFGISSDVNTLSGTVGGGGDRGFGSLLGSWATIDSDPKFNGWTLGGLFGSQIAADTRRRIMLCPFGQVELGRFVNLPGDIETPTLIGTQAGLSVGITAISGTVASLVPTVRVGFVSLKSYGAEETFGELGEQHGELAAGVGVVLNGGRSAIVALITRPFAADEPGETGSC